MRYSVLFVLFLTACAQSEETFDVGDKRLIGHWEWAKTEDFEPENYYEQLQTPELVGRTERLEFTEEGEFVKTVNDERADLGVFETYGDGKLRMSSLQESVTFNYEIQSGDLTLEALADSGVVITYIKTRPKN